jgi:7-keto-8-aminopelargonate synthetase-like enzyme
VTYFSERLDAFPRIEPYRLVRDAGYWPFYKTVESASKPRITVEGREVINFGSNNYLSLSYHPKVVEAAIAATRHFGAGVTGSRLLNGTLSLHRELEAELADFYGREAALVFTTGYVANVAAIAGFLGRGDHAVIDKEIHNSLLTGVKLCGAAMKRFRHNDVAHLEKALGGLDADAGKGIIVDGVYSMGGDTAPLDRLVSLAQSTPGTFLLDDEAHGFGVLGERGLGAAEQYGVLDTVDLITITFSKTLGSCGGAVIASKDAIELLTLTSDTFIFTASNTPGSVAAALAALRVMRAEPERPRQLRANVASFLAMLAERGIPTNPVESAIVTIPLRLHDDLSTVLLALDLLDKGVFVNPVIPPASSRDIGLIRLSLMVDHDLLLLEEAADVLAKVLAEHEQLPAE